MQNKTRHLTLDALMETGAFAGITRGHATIERFCKAVDAGQTPRLEDMRALADALRHLRYEEEEARATGDNFRRDALAKFSATLGLTRKQGRQEKGAGYASEMARPSRFFLIEKERLLAQGHTPSYAKQKARQIAIEQEAKITGRPEMSSNTFDKRHKEWLDWAEMEIKLLRMLEARLGNMPGK